MQNMGKRVNKWCKRGRKGAKDCGNAHWHGKSTHEFGGQWSRGSTGSLLPIAL